MRCVRRLAPQPGPDDRGTLHHRGRILPKATSRLGNDLRVLDQEIAESALDDAAIERLITITGRHLTVAAGLVAAIGDIGRFSSPQKLVSYFGLNPRVRQSGLGAAHHGRIGARSLVVVCAGRLVEGADAEALR